MKTLQKHLYYRLRDALQTEGTFEPTAILPHIEEGLKTDEYSTLNGFLRWVTDTGRTFGNGNYTTVFAAYLQTN